jgi:hypothetical protein
MHSTKHGKLDGCEKRGAAAGNMGWNGENRQRE